MKPATAQHFVYNDGGYEQVFNSEAEAIADVNRLAAQGIRACRGRESAMNGKGFWFTSGETAKQTEATAAKHGCLNCGRPIPTTEFWCNEQCAKESGERDRTEATARPESIADRYARELFADIERLPVDSNGEYLTEGDFGMAIQQAIDEDRRNQGNSHDALVAAARCALADLEGIMPEFEPSGDREHPAWITIKELRAALAAAEVQP